MGHVRETKIQIPQSCRGLHFQNSQIIFELLNNRRAGARLPILVENLSKNVAKSEKSISRVLEKSFCNLDEHIGGGLLTKEEVSSSGVHLSDGEGITDAPGWPFAIEAAAAEQSCAPRTARTRACRRA